MMPSAPPKLILLTGQAEAPFLTGFLEDAGTSPPPIIHVEDLASLDSAAAPGDRLICFLCEHVIPAPLLGRLDYNAYNFHPGTPDYPGSHPVSFALYDGARDYGVTAHRMADRVDSGEIVGLEEISVGADWNYIDLSEAAMIALGALFRRLAPQMLRIDKLLPPIGLSWADKANTRRRHDELTRISDDIDDRELARRFRAFEGIYSPL